MLLRSNLMIKRLALVSLLTCVVVTTFFFYANSSAKGGIHAQKTTKQLLNEFYAYKKKNDNEKSKKVLYSILSRDSKNLTALKELGYLNIKQGKELQAIIILRKVQQLEPHNNDITLQLGYLYFNEAKYKEAQYEFEKLINSNDPSTREKVRKALMAIKNFQESILKPHINDDSTIVAKQNTQEELTSKKSEKDLVEKKPSQEKQAQRPLNNADIAMNNYYQLKKTHPLQAQRELVMITIQYPSLFEAKVELGYYYLRKNLPKKALVLFKEAVKLKPKELNLQLQLAYIYQKIGRVEKAKEYFSLLSKIRQESIRVKADQEFRALKKLDLFSKKDRMLKEYYRLNKINKKKALSLLIKIVESYPNSIKAQRELGYRYLALKEERKALPHFEEAQRINPSDYQVVEQLGYIYQNLKMFNRAYEQFRNLRKSPDKKVSLKASNTLIYLKPLKDRWFKEPWFFNLYTAPFYTARFGAYVFPIDIKFGRYLDSNKQFALYLRTRYTLDTKSLGGLIPDIFDDNAMILSLGLSLQPLKSIPALLYVEYGAGYDLIDRNRELWRPDFRSGITFYQYWGPGSHFSPKLVFLMKPQADAYGDFSFYSRYEDNWIGAGRIRAGFRVAEFKYSSIGVYLKGAYVFDTNHEFFNNIGVVGVGASITPFNPLNLIFRVERNYGFYVPVNSPSPNPFGPRYKETLFFVELYAQL